MKGKPNTIATEMERRGKYANKSTVSYNVIGPLQNNICVIQCW